MDHETGFASIRVTWWRNTLDRRFWSVFPLSGYDVLLGDLEASIKCVVDDFGNLVRVS